MLFRSPKSKPVGGVYLAPGNETLDLILMNEQHQVLLFSSALIEPLNRRSNFGQRVQKLKKGSRTEVFRQASELAFDDANYYVARTLPQPGRYLREESLTARQIGLEEL